MLSTQGTKTRGRVAPSRAHAPDHPEHAGSLSIGPSLALAGTIAIGVGAWEALRDDCTSLYQPAEPQARPRP
jgi:hypothetical protein